MATVPLWKKIGIEKSKDRVSTQQGYSNPIADQTLSEEAKHIYQDFFKTIKQNPGLTPQHLGNCQSHAQLKPYFVRVKQQQPNKRTGHSETAMLPQQLNCPEFQRGMMLSPFDYEINEGWEQTQKNSKKFQVPVDTQMPMINWEQTSIEMRKDRKKTDSL